MKGCGSSYTVPHHTRTSSYTVGIAGDSRGIAGDSRGIAGDSRGIAGA